jgi:anti-sigma B factor antagonist
MRTRKGPDLPARCSQAIKKFVEEGEGIVEIQAEQHDRAVVITVTGSIDALTASELTRFFSEQIKPGEEQIVADMSQVDFMSSAGLRALLGALKESRQLGGDLYVAAPQPGVEKILKMSGFTSILKVYASVEEAVAGFQSGKPFETR